VIDRDTYLRLQNVIRREGRSFLQYAGESFPWNTPQNREKADAILRLAHEEREGAAALSRYLVKHKLTPPYLGAYPAYFTSYNYLSLDRLLPMLVDYQQRGLAELETDFHSLQDAPTRQQVEELAAMKRRHLKTLEALSNSK
jgi:hypothetical protein